MVEAVAALDVAAALDSGALEALAVVSSSFGVRATTRGSEFHHPRRRRAPGSDRVRIFGGLRERRTAIVAIKAVVVESFTDGAVIRDEIAATRTPQVKLSPMTSSFSPRAPRPTTKSVKVTTIEVLFSTISVKVSSMAVRIR
jgi:hypothetical protein